MTYYEQKQIIYGSKDAFLNILINFPHVDSDLTPSREIWSLRPSEGVYLHSIQGISFIAMYVIALRAYGQCRVIFK